MGRFTAKSWDLLKSRWTANPCTPVRFRSWPPPLKVQSCRSVCGPFADSPRLGVRDRLPLPEPLRDQLHALPVVGSVEDAHVLGIGAPVNAGGAHIRARIRTGREIPGGAIGGLEPDLPGAVELRRVRVPGSLSLPIIKDARRLLLLL